MPSDRTDFLREYYRLLADDIRRHEAIVPKVCSLQVGVMVVLVTIQWLRGPIYGATLVALLTSAWAMHLLVDANLWARRSQLMAANVELEFFTSADMEVLLPRSYYGEGRRYRYRRVFRVGMLLSLAFFFTCLILLPLTLNLKSLTTLLIAVLLLCSVHLENRKCAQEFAYLVEHAAGRIRVDAQ